MRAGLERRLAIRKQIAAVADELEKLEAAALTLDKPLYRRLLLLRRCASMDAMPLCERQKSLAFASAMTALEGVTASPDTDRRLASWVQGEDSFAELYMDKLRQDHLIEG